MRDIVLGGAFIILWWFTLLILLPIGLHSGGGEAVAGADPGAPHKPKLLLKAGIATVIAIVLWGVFYALVVMKVIDL
jgi:predicted secreted protein